MTKEQINQRLYLLFIALQFHRQEIAFFTIGECIVINQERGQLRYALTYSEATLRPVSQVIENKIIKIDQLIQAYNWQPLNKIDFNDDKKRT